MLASDDKTIQRLDWDSDKEVYVPKMKLTGHEGLLSKSLYFFYTSPFSHVKFVVVTINRWNYMYAV